MCEGICLYPLYFNKSIKMTVSYIKDSDLLKVEVTEITSDMSAYTSITLNLTLNCGSVITKTQSITDTASNTNPFYITAGILYLKASLFSLGIYVDGIYKVSIKLTKVNSGGYLLLDNCIFVDITYKCKVAAYLQNLVEENKTLDESEKIGTIIHLLHYGLVNGSNCGCNCAELCVVFNELKDLLINTEPQNPECGC